MRIPLQALLIALASIGPALLVAGIPTSGSPGDISLSQRNYNEVLPRTQTEVFPRAATDASGQQQPVGSAEDPDKPLNPDQATVSRKPRVRKGSHKRGKRRAKRDILTELD
ncbi:hypothetical protein C8J56DRAFT_932441 [Mycena floridula]|nr:hypothetical protein C8J56DRAFT_932441 [Mycena floridula]